MKMLTNLASRVLTIINKFTPKNRKRIVLYSNLGFRDNVEAFYHYLVTNGYYKKYRIIVSSNDYKSIHHVNGVKYISCFKGIFYFLTSRYFFYSFGKYNIMPSKKQCVVNLWHGMPLKTIGNLEKGKEKNKYDYFSYVLSTSHYFDDVMMKSFKCGSERIMNCGQPRTDYFYKNNNTLFKGYKNTAIWMPTFRTSDILNESNTSKENRILPLINNMNDLESINSLFKKNNSLLLIKLHPIQSKKNMLFSDLSNIKFIDEEFLKNNNTSLYEFLPQTDFLITDYSSVYFDYLLLDKNIVFIIDDLSDYKKNRGLNFENFEDIMPGPKVVTIKSFLSELDKIFNDRDEYVEQRKKINLLLNEYSSKNNCKDICDFCGIKGE